MDDPSKNSDSALIVLAAGMVTQDFVSVLDATTPALLPYMGRPLIYQIIVNHIKRYGRDVMIAVPENEPRLEDFLQASFGDRVQLRIVRMAPSETSNPTTSLCAVLDTWVAMGMNGKPAFIVYGDVYVELDAIGDCTRPTAFMIEYVDSDKYSYFVAQDGAIHHVKKPSKRASNEPARDEKRYTDIGAYWVPSLQEMQEKIHASTASLPSTVGRLMANLYPTTLQCVPAQSWSDLGHLDTATQIRTRLIGAREFNTLAVDEERGLITKKSRNKNKILQEIQYYQKLPRQLSIYFPRLHDFNIGDDTAYTMEFYGYRTLSEYFVFFNFPVSVWKKILTRILKVQAEFNQYTGKQIPPAQVVDFYVGKLKDRMAAIPPSSPIYDFMHADTVTVNGEMLHGWQFYQPHIEAAVHALAEKCVTSVVHGDLCFSNILYDPQTSLVKLIDPRGAFFEEGCFGDPRYDLAKLLHSFHGGYDYIIQEMYDITTHADGSCDFRLFQSPEAAALAEHLVPWMREHVAFDMRELLLLEALLFLSMLPLHSDDADRQKAFYIIGIKILREVFGADLL